MYHARGFRVPGLVSLALVLFLVLGSVADAAPPAASGGSAASSPGIGSGEPLERQGQPVLHRVSPSSVKVDVPARQVLGEPQAVQLSTFSVNYLTEGTAWQGYTCHLWPQAARDAFDYAAGIWGSRVRSSVPITVDACWTSFTDPDVLGGAWPNWYWRDFTGAPVAKTWYPKALANALNGTELDAAHVDIDAVFASGFPWYYSTSGTPGSGQYDFATAVARELGYGLGYESTMWVSGGLGHWGSYTDGDPAKILYPDVYDRLVVNGSGQSLIGGFVNPSSALAAQLQSNNVYFDGAQARAANGGNRPKLFAGSPWTNWNISYLDVIYDGTANALMTPTLNPQEVVHDPGPMGLAILNDLGWSSDSTVTAFKPASANVGASVAISGTNLSGTIAVSFNGVPASFSNFSSAEIVATVPAGATTGLVSVTTASGSVQSTVPFTITDAKPPQVALLGSPVRLVDTRTLSGYQGSGQAMLGSPNARPFQLAGQGGIPANATAVLVNLTAAGYKADGWISAWPACTAWPGTSSLNFDTVENAIANFAVVKLGVGSPGSGCQGAINVTGNQGTNVIIDVVGYVVTTTDDQIVLLDAPQRLVDTRSGSPIPANPSSSRFKLGGSGPIPADATAVLTNLTAVGYHGNGWISAWPACTAWPGTSSLNFDTDENAIANSAMVKLGEASADSRCQGAIDVTAAVGTDFIVDVVGYIVPTASSGSDQLAFLATPQRFVDTRFGNAPALQGGVARCFQVAGINGVPADAQGVVVNLTAVGYSKDGWIAAYPNGEVWSGTSSVNFDTQENAIANSAVVHPGTDGKVCLLASSSTHAIIDVSAYLK